MVTPIDQLNMGLLDRQLMRPITPVDQLSTRALDGMGLGLLGPIPKVNIGSQLMSAAQPTALGKVRGALGQSLSNPNILRGIAAGLLSGPSRTPVSFGQSLLGGLQAGQQLQEAEEDRKLKRMLAEAELSKLQRGTMPKLGAPQTYYDQQGNPISVYSKETPFGTLEALEYGTDKPVDLTGLSKDKPTFGADKLGTLYSYKDASGKRETIYDSDPSFIQIQSQFDVFKVGTEQQIKQKSPIEFEIVEEIGNPLNTIMTYFDPNTGERVSEQTGELIDMEKYQRQPVITPKFSDIQSGFDALVENENAVTNMKRFSENVDTANFGIRGKLDDLVSDFKALVEGSTSGLTAQQMARQIAKTNQEGLVGLLKESVVGGGVMTEEDARRILRYMGGAVGDWTAKPEIILEAIEYAIKERVKTGSQIASKYNSMQKRSADFDAYDTSYLTYTPKMLAPQSFLDDGFTQSRWRTLPKAEKDAYR
tara:strand:+ start:265 stop:1698 length:1434 start_codon:yes stop_codon:yes gene_type:complete